MAQARNASTGRKLRTIPTNRNPVRKAFSKKTHSLKHKPIAVFRLRQIPASYCAALPKVRLRKPSIVPKCLARRRFVWVEVQPWLWVIGQGITAAFLDRLAALTRRYPRPRKRGPKPATR